MHRLASTVLRLPVLVVAGIVLAATPACSPPPSAASTPALPPVSPLPEDLVKALATFRAEGPRGWAFTQTTVGGGKDRVERYDPRQRGAARWTLLSEKGAVPTEAEQQRYRDTRPAYDSAADLANQLVRESAALAAKDERTTTYEFHLRPGSDKDETAAHMRARFTLDHPTGTITRVELFNIEPFKPASSLTIHEARTTLVYSLPTDTRPSLPQEVTMLVRGERFWIRDFEQKVTSTYSDQENASKSAAP